MKKIIGGAVLLAIVCGLIHLSGCNDPDPCLGKQIMGGSFTMGERITNYGGVDTLLVSDTIITDNVAVFRADSTYVSYEWKIGDDPRTFDKKEVSLRFMEPVSAVPVRLIAKWRPDKDCFPLDDGVDTVYKQLTVIDKKKNPIFGKFQGALVSNQSDVYTVEISTDEYFDRLYVTNINKGCEASDIDIPIRMGYKAVSLSKDETTNFYGGLCKNPTGWIFLNKYGDEMNAKYTVGNGSQFQSETKRSREQFIGKKI